MNYLKVHEPKGDTAVVPCDKILLLQGFVDEPPLWSSTVSKLTPAEFCCFVTSILACHEHVVDKKLTRRYFTYGTISRSSDRDIFSDSDRTWLARIVGTSIEKELSIIILSYCTRQCWQYEVFELADGSKHRSITSILYAMLLCGQSYRI